MGRRTMGLLALTALLALGTAAIANAAKTTIRAGNLILTFGSTISPNALPKAEFAPVTATIEGEISTTDKTHPSAFRETVVDVDRDFKVSVRGLPVCKAVQLEATDTKAARRACGATTLGSGLAHAEIAFPEQPVPIKVTSPITVFNGGEKGGKITLLIHTFITVPVPAAIVTQVTIQRKGSGLHSVAKVPVIAGGSGSALDFKFKLGRTYTYKGRRASFLEARCPDGVFKASSPKTVFRNEAQTPEVPATTVLHGGLAIPCTPKG
jgi:hypothetical protein